MPDPVSFLDAIKNRYGAEDDIDSYDSSAFLVGDPSRRRNKKWELVGMDRTRERQSRYDQLVDVVLRDKGITVAVKPSEVRVSDAVREGETQTYKDDLAAQRMISLKELDLSANKDLPLSEVAKLIPYFARLDTLQLSDMPTLLPSATATDTGVVLASGKLTKLVLNNVGFRSLVHLRRFINLPQLMELHLDSNHLSGLTICADEQEEGLLREKGGDAWLAMSSVHTLSLAHNSIVNWEELGSALSRAFPGLKRLYLTGNALPNLILPVHTVAAVARKHEEAALATNKDSADSTTGNSSRSNGGNGVVEAECTAAGAAPTPSYIDEISPALAARYAFLRPLSLLCLNENERITDTQTVDAIRVLCPNLEVFRITYSALLPRWNDTLSRMYVIAAMPTIQLLNRGQVRAKERLDSEIFYVQRGLAQREAAQSQQQQESNAGKQRESSSVVEGERGRCAQPVASEALASEPSYPLLDLLREKHRSLVLSIYRAGATATADGCAHVMLDVRLRCENHYKGGTEGTQGRSIEEANPFAELRRTLPSNLTIEQLKALLRVAFQVALPNQEVSYRSGDEGVLGRPVAMDNERQTLAYYGVSNGAIITVRDTSLR